MDAKTAQKLHDKHAVNLLWERRTGKAQTESALEEVFTRCTCPTCPHHFTVECQIQKCTCCSES